MIPSDVTAAAITSPTTDPGVTPPGSLPPGGYGEGDGFRFSARTCIAILPLLTEEQLDKEISYLMKYNPTAISHLRIKGVEGKREHLKNHLSSTLCTEIDKIVTNYDELLSSISGTLGNAGKKLGDYTTQSHVTATGSSSHLEVETGSDPGNLPSPVSVWSDINFADIPLTDVMNSIEFDQSLSGHRQAAYFGPQPYSYSYTKHSPKDYPAGPIFN